MLKGPGSGFLVCAAALFAIFAAHVAAGKIAIANGATEAPGLGDIGEALLLFAAVCLFVAATLRREAASRRPGVADPVGNRAGQSRKNEMGGFE